MKNQVIKVLNKEHGKKVIKYWKNIGIDTQDYEGTVTEEEGGIKIYYGIINDHFRNYSLNELINTHIITLPNLEFPKEMLVGNNSDQCKIKRWVVFIDSNPNAKYPIHAINSSNESPSHKEYEIYTWKYAKEIPNPQIKITVEINGKLAKLSDVSDETLKKLKEIC